MARVTLKQREEATRETVRFIPTGSTLLDLVLGGGWAEGRVANVVGDKSAGKTLLAIEAAANFRHLFPRAPIAYRESEAAFDLPYAHSMGLPKDVDWLSEENAVKTVEDWEKDLGKWLESAPSGPNLYILDSLDALSDSAEMDREIGTATYGTGKAKMLSELFRRQIAKIREKRCTMLVISQIRDKIGVTFGETKTRSGGRALDFYASQIVWLSELKKLQRKVTGVDRVVGVEIRARNKKNKVGTPFRQADMSILFNYGVDDEASMIDWLHDNKGEAFLSESLVTMIKLYKDARAEQDREGARVIHDVLATAVRARWAEIEDALAPPMSKYGE